VWEGLMAGASDQDIANVIASRFDVDLEQALDDVRALAGDLLARGLVEAA
jgi:hypothetical protein